MNHSTRVTDATKVASRGALVIAVLLVIAPSRAEAQSTLCNQPVSGHVVLTDDVNCVDSDGLVVAADNTTIHLNGFTIRCTDPDGYKGSCQGGDVVNNPAPNPDPDTGNETQDFGIDTAGCGPGGTVGACSNVNIQGPGRIQGFDIGVFVFGGPADGPSAKNIKVRKVNVTAPDGRADFSLFLAQERPSSFGILVQNFVSSSGNALEVFGNAVDNHTIGIAVYNASDVDVKMNFVHDNNDAGTTTSVFESHGILVCTNEPLCDPFGLGGQVAARNKIHNNLVVDNGQNLGGLHEEPDSGITVTGPGTSNNDVVHNNVSFNNGDGVVIRNGANNNRIANNSALYNTTYEASAEQPFYDISHRAPVGANNTFHTNNRCEKESPLTVPENVCNLGEGDWWK